MAVLRIILLKVSLDYTVFSVTATLRNLHYLGSWDESIKNRFKHVRKYDAKKRKISFQDTANESSPITKEVTKPKRIKRVDFWNDIPTISKEKECVIGEHLAELSKECSLPTKNQNIGKINQLMISSFEFRRIAIEILTKLIPVKDLVQKYPPLKKVSGVSCLLRGSKPNKSSIAYVLYSIYN